ncbi:hypothetical protein F4808DRAFT_457094 [Astrocystis sublimbata]|nr:hypothetical protein F4808DRAFT_457094 [Astrocystis sublimbata]
MTEVKDFALQNPKGTRCVFKPVTNRPDEAKKFVREIFKKKPENIELIAAQMAPLFGLGATSTKDPLARSRAQALFTSPIIYEALQEFLNVFINGEFGLPLADFHTTLDLVHIYRDDENWSVKTSPLKVGRDSVDEHYARFIIRTLVNLEAGTGKGAKMLQWLRQGMLVNREDEVTWVLFHTLLCFQIKRMELNKAHTPNRVLAARLFHSFFTHVNNFVSARRGHGSQSIKEGSPTP